MEQDKNIKKITFGVCCLKTLFSYTRCETCFCNRSFSSISNLFMAVNFLFTACNRPASFLCFSLHLQSKNQLTNKTLINTFHQTVYPQQTPSILEPDFDLFRLNVRKNRTLSDKLLTTERSRFGTFMVEPLKRFDLLRRVAYVFTVVHCYFASVFAS